VSGRIPGGSSAMCAGMLHRHRLLWERPDHLYPTDSAAKTPARAKSVQLCHVAEWARALRASFGQARRFIGIATLLRAPGVQMRKAPWPNPRLPADIAPRRRHCR